MIGFAYKPKLGPVTIRDDVSWDKVPPGMYKVTDATTNSESDSDMLDLGDFVMLVRCYNENVNLIVPLKTGQFLLQRGSRIAKLRCGRTLTLERSNEILQVTIDADAIGR